jgi:hypothetical protein
MENNKNQISQQNNLEKQAAGEEQKRNFPGQGQAQQDAEQKDADKEDDEPAK